MDSPKKVINLYEIRPKKTLGQSFLIEPAIIQSIVDAADFKKTDVVVEVGAGIGVLTEYIARKVRRVIAVEIDSKLINVLEHRLSEYGNVHIHHGDILRYSFKRLAEEENDKIKIIGNIPYNITSPFLFYLLSFMDSIDCFFLMMQKEVVERLVASSGNKSYGVPSVIMQMFVDVERIMDIGASNFYPKPQVESSVMRGIFREKPLTELFDKKLFGEIVRIAFAQRRKTIFNNLRKANLLKGVEEYLINDVLKICGIDSRRRAETLSPEEFGILSNVLTQNYVLKQNE